MKKDFHLFIIWQNGRDKEQAIIKDLAGKFDIIKVFGITWSPELFAHNLSRFYGKNLKKVSKKARECGTGEFLLITLYDTKESEPHPKKNLNIYTTKCLYREWNNGGFLVHASDNKTETEDNLMIMLGTTIAEFEKKHNTPWNGTIEQLQTNPPFSSGWENEQKLYTYIKTLPFSNPNIIARQINAKPFIKWLNLYKIKIGGKNKIIRLNKKSS